jgi:ABC transport system ATP-binding/permease protein
MWKLRIEDDQSNRTVVSLVRKQYAIGRSEENAVRLTERNVSRTHATLERAGDGWTLKDLGSYNGTLVDDRLVQGQIGLAHNSRIRIGDYGILLYDSSLGEEPNDGRLNPLTEPAQQDGLGHRLVVIEGPNVGTEYPLGDRRLLVGRGEECDIALNDTSVSRVHADIEPDESGRYRINDQHSSNGVRVNGVDVQSTTLYSGDIVELGDVQLQFVPKGQPFTRSDHPRAVIAAVRNGPLGAISTAQKWAALAVGSALVATVFTWALSSEDQPSTRPLQASPATEALELARSEFQRGNVTAAHRAILTIRNDSNLKNSKVFRQIEAAWADEQLRLAETTRDLDSRRRILGAVAQAETVEPTRRQQALDRLATLSAQAPEELPHPSAGDAGAGKPKRSISASAKAGAGRKAEAQRPAGKRTPKEPTRDVGPNAASAGTEGTPRHGSEVNTPVVLENAPDPLLDPAPNTAAPEPPRKPDPSVTTTVP